MALKHLAVCLELMKNRKMMNEMTSLNKIFKIIKTKNFLGGFIVEGFL